MQAQDPAIVGSVQEVLPPPNLGERLYRPSYATAHTFQMEAEPPQPSPAFPAARSLLDACDPPKAAVPRADASRRRHLARVLRGVERP